MGMVRERWSRGRNALKTSVWVGGGWTGEILRRHSPARHAAVPPHALVGLWHLPQYRLASAVLLQCQVSQAQQAHADEE